MTPHKHADLIKQWADGAEIEFKSSDGHWFPSTNNQPGWSPHREYRIKPQPQKRTVWIAIFPDYEVLFNDNDAIELFNKHNLPCLSIKKLELEWVDGEGL